MRMFLAALFLLTALAVPARAEQPACTGDRHYDETGQCCPFVTTSTTLPPSSCESDEDCDDSQRCQDGVCVDVSCPDTPPCPPVEVTCTIDVCVKGACTNGSLGTDGAGACDKDTDCQIVTTVTNTTTNNVFNVTVNRCPVQETVIPCRRQDNGRLVCPRTGAPRRELVPYSVALHHPSSRKGKKFHLPTTGPK